MKEKAGMLTQPQIKLAPWIVILVVLILGHASAGFAQTVLKPHVDEALADPDTTAYLQINTPEGTFYVRFFGQDDGPVELPLKSRLTALLISPELTEQGWRVHLGVQEDVLRVTPLGRYDLALDQEVPLKGLGGLGTGNWKMKLTMGDITPDAIDGCCSCGRINCCPTSGKCLGCGKCGVCCGGGAPEV